MRAWFCVLLVACQRSSSGPVDGAAPPATAASSTSASVPPPGTAPPAPTALPVSTSSSEVTGLLAAVASYDAGTAPASLDASDGKAVFRKTKMDDAELVRIVQQIPELSRLGSELRFFATGDANAIAGRAKDDANGITFSAQPVYWSPEPSVDVLVLTGRGKNASFVLALYPQEGGSFRLASFFLFAGDVAPVVLAYRPERRRELFWTTCWNCSGDQGGISFRDDRRVVIVQH
jgi:hypothetical protein